MLFRPIRAALALTAILALTLSTGAAAQAGGKDLIATATAAGKFKTLLTLIDAAGLTKTLQGKGPYTVFAPTDEAFAAVPAATMTALKADKAKLAALLNFHVVPGTVMAADFNKNQDAQKYTTFKTAAGSDLKVHMGRHVGKDFANLVQTDIAASNGVIHVVDKVLMP